MAKTSKLLDTNKSGKSETAKIPATNIGKPAPRVHTPHGHTISGNVTRIGK